MDEFVSMENFVAVVEAGSLTAAAERFDISSAMVGKLIRPLETRLATRLLTRTTRRQSLMEIGQRYCEQCRRILADVKEAESLAEATTAAPRGVLKVTAMTTMTTMTTIAPSGRAIIRFTADSLHFTTR